MHEKTGLVLDPYFSAPSCAGCSTTCRGARERAERGELAFGTIDTCLLWKLTGGAVHATDVTNASRTLLMDLETRAWDDELCALFGVPRGVLPEIRPSSEVFGVTRGVRGLPDGIPIAGIAGDQQAALFGQACFSRGEAKCTYGTGAFLLHERGPRKPIARSTACSATVAWQVGGEVALRARGERVRRRRGGAVAARRARALPQVFRGGGARGVGAGLATA